MQSEISKHPLTEQRLTLEFEAAMLTESGHAGRLLERLRADGVRVAAVDRSGRLAQIQALIGLPLNALRLPAATLHTADPTVVGPMLEGWYRGAREVIADDLRDLGAIAKLWNLGVDYLQGDMLATASPRLDFDFSEINLG
jgi:EAL domain-containing protein (putative c-di-GMP-specific phosphodiesterase class I)